MASSTTTIEPEIKSSSAPIPLPALDYSKIDVILRFLLFGASVSALASIVSSDETELVLFQGVPVLQPAKFKYSPALIYFVCAFTVSGFYGLLTTIISISLIQNPPPPSLLGCAYTGDSGLSNRNSQKHCICRFEGKQPRRLDQNLQCV
ncbi:hypothetical protein PIB30_009852 [Stylosanthes scabra]|uniref:CASP-like protein n=1 Tax=Stylosanthes scabra TaxID=79078 RepID=A0ABU6Q5E4_9FABA|nr:hypothetical protein [Stylosanthes scabra]